MLHWSASFIFSDTSMVGSGKWNETALLSVWQAVLVAVSVEILWLIWIFHSFVDLRQHFHWQGKSHGLVMLLYQLKRHFNCIFPDTSELWLCCAIAKYWQLKWWSRNAGRCLGYVHLSHFSHEPVIFNGVALLFATSIAVDVFGQSLMCVLLAISLVVS